MKIVLLLLLLLLLPPSAAPEVTCPTPKSVEHADIQVKSHSVKSREHYVCVSGFKRQAGTSNLIQCILDQKLNTAYWTETNLKCIRDPAQKSPFSTVSPRELLTFPGKDISLESETSKSDTTVATEILIVTSSISLSSSPHTASPELTGMVSKPVSKEISSEPPSTTVILTTQNWSFTVLAQTTQTLEQSSPSTHGKISGKQHVLIPVSVFASFLIVLLELWLCIKRRNSVPEPLDETEDMPMAGQTDSKEEFVGS
ncbi:interleukin-15 receptor subunit alpha-like [Macrotis lagotis]|uniref:interleukin-15 receptor subunit alpha-like n=1 Tax=Macrotis lagotis TaxID=92651 RepID=UPI003D685DFF